MADTSSSKARTPATSKKQSTLSMSSSAGAKQKSILGFFSKTPSQASAARPVASSSPSPALSPPALKETTNSNARALPKQKSSFSSTKNNITPVPSSDAAEPLSSQENRTSAAAASKNKVRFAALPSPVTPAELPVKQAIRVTAATMNSSPTRKAKKTVSYAESSDEEDEDIFASLERTKKNRTARNRSRSTIVEDDEDEYMAGNGSAAEEMDDDVDMDDFIASEDSDGPPTSRKRKRASKAQVPRKKATRSPTPVQQEEEEFIDDDIDDNDLISSDSRTQQWLFDPNHVQPARPALERQPSPGSKDKKEKAHTKEPEQRYSWLADVKDIDLRSPGDPDFDKSTIYIPPGAFHKFSAFEQQYWAIKQKLWDTVVFFKKGKFYELYENDATIGHQLFDFKLTDRVNMRMAGVPEGSVGVWMNQFIAKGYKVARVDQMESQLGKEMRERGGAPSTKKADKVIRRELACIYTSGTLVDGSMLQDDMATYVAAIKETVVDDKPVFGIAFADCATGQFFLSEFEDDIDLTKFETFVAQTNPREVIVEKGHLSSKALRLLKTSTFPTAAVNLRKPRDQFWDADLTRRELDASGYFLAEQGEDEVWPEQLTRIRDQDTVMSAFGGLVEYLRYLKIERDLLSQGHFEWYNPIQRDGTLILDGQTLTNLEVFNNTVDQGPNGTLFTLLNRCITPFGKRLFRQWVCHPLCNIRKINERLDAVDMLNADRSLRDQFSSEMTKMPDLERLISRVHALACDPRDFVRVLEGFEQIEYTMGLLSAFGGGNGLVDRLLASMPDLSEPLAYWKTAFDRTKAREERKLIPEKGINEDFDQSLETLDEIKAELNSLLQDWKTELKCSKLKFTDIGKEVYQIEAPKAIKVPKNWRQMSATAAVKRYYFPDLEKFVRKLQEAEETHAQTVKEMANALFQQFDKDFEVWLQALHIIAQLDCLISLAKTSSALGEPSCRPTFVEQERSLVEFEELRHPCMLNTVDDFIPNDIKLGGDEAKINLLTGANAAGKSTVLRMSCIAVIMAQIGCYVPAISARLTPVDRIMSRLGANDNIFASQSTFFVELSETKKILCEATPRSLVILDELGRGTSSYDGVAVAQAVLHHVASHIGCLGYFATHYHSLATEFESHPEIRAKRMQILVDDDNRAITFLYKLEDGVAEGSFGMHCAAMCGIPQKVIDRAEVAAREWEHTSRLKESLDQAKTGSYIPLGVLSDVSSLLRSGTEGDGAEMGQHDIDVLLRAIDNL